MTVKDLIQHFDQKSSQIPVSNSAARELLRKERITQIKNLSTPQDEVAAELAIYADNPCNESMSGNQMTHWIIVAQFHPSIKYLESLCRILECESFFWHEGIVDILYDLKDERAIPSLEKALTYEFDYDPWRHLGVKILETLYVIGTPSAFEIIKRFLRSSSPELRKTANILCGKG